MYNEDDAVAKIDGYVISVAQAGKLIGEERLVRIERVGRSAASATIVGGANGQPEEAGEEAPKPRRRGRRGGRRRRQRAEDVAE